MSWRLNIKNTSKVVTDIHRLHPHQIPDLQNSCLFRVKKKGGVFNKGYWAKIFLSVNNIGYLWSTLYKITVNVK